MEGQDVSDEGNGGKDNTEETVDDELDENIEGLSEELMELIEKSEPAFHPLIWALYHAVTLICVYF